MSSDFKDYYSILGVARNSNSEDLKKSYRRLARKYHPDMNPGDKAAENRFKEITEAYEVLSDADKRRRYDHFGQYVNQPGGSRAAASSSSSSKRGGYTPTPDAGSGGYDFGSYGSFDDFLNELLGRANNPGGRAATNRPDSTTNVSTSSNGDREANISLTLLEAFKGAEKSFNIGNENIKIRIPLGAKPGSRVRVRGKGGMNSFSKQRGDLYLTIAIKNSDFFQFEKDNLICELPISPDEAVLGAHIQVPTLDGTVTLNVPAGVQSGQSLRLRGKGWYNAKGERGDQLVKVQIATPKKITNNEKELYEKLRSMRSSDPRQNFSQVKFQ